MSLKVTELKFMVAQTFDQVTKLAIACLIVEFWFAYEMWPETVKPDDL